MHWINISALYRRAENYVIPRTKNQGPRTEDRRSLWSILDPRSSILDPRSSAFTQYMPIFGLVVLALWLRLLVWGAASYRSADNAHGCLPGTFFLFGLPALFGLLLKARSPGWARPIYALLAGLSLGALVLLRSVALPLLPLGALWLLLQNQEPR